MRGVKDFDIDKVKVSEVIICITEEDDWEGCRKYLIESNEYYHIEGDEHCFYGVIEGYHCSCMGYNDKLEMGWELTLYTKQELIAIANMDYNEEDLFWKTVREYNFY